MTVTCCIRYVLDPFPARRVRGLRAHVAGHHPACGGELVGCFMPHEGTNNIALALISFDEPRRLQKRTAPA